jgi:hypothetical protein
VAALDEDDSWTVAGFVAASAMPPAPSATTAAAVTATVNGRTVILETRILIR